MRACLQRALGIVVIAIASCTSPSALSSRDSQNTTSLPVTHGQITPVRHAQAGTISGGVVFQISVEIGDAVMENEEIARVRGPLNGAIEIVTAPFAGTVTDVLVQSGDTVLPGAIIVAMGDLRRLQIETSDVDEYIIATIRQGQPVRLIVDALDRLELRGVVRTVSLVPRVVASGDQHYPVVIDFETRPEELRPGMTVRIAFEP